jgi:hypothetical protein
MIARNVPGIRATSLTPDIEEADSSRSWPAEARHSIDVRHTVGWSIR